MLINLRNALMAGKRTPTAKDYVQNGLVAMWDGIENAGWGTHDASATTWKDLAGNRDMTLSALGSFAENRLINQPGGAGASFDGGMNSGGTLEVVLKASSWYKYARTIYVYIGNVLCFGQRNSLKNGPMGGEVKGSVVDSNLGINVLRSWSIYRTNGGIGTILANGERISLTSYSQAVVQSETPISVNALTYQTDFYSIRVYNRALTDAEIAANLAIDKARFGLP